MDLSAPSYCKDHNQHLGNFCPQCCKFLCGQCECPHYPDVNLIPYWYINKYLKSVNIEQSIPTEEQIKEAKAAIVDKYKEEEAKLKNAFTSAVMFLDTYTNMKNESAGVKKKLTEIGMNEKAFTYINSLAEHRKEDDLNFMLKQKSYKSYVDLALAAIKNISLVTEKFNELLDFLKPPSVYTDKIVHTIQNSAVNIGDTISKVKKNFVLSKPINVYADSISFKGRIFIMGGKGPVDETYEMSIDNQKLIQKEPMLCKKYDHSLCVVCPFIYSIGGCNGTTAYSDCEKYDVEHNKWEALPPLNTPRYMCGSFSFNKSSVYAFAGYKLEYLNSIEKLNVNEHKNWENVKVNNMCSTRYAVHGIQIRNNEVIIFGGCDNTGNKNDSYILTVSDSGIDCTKHMILAATSLFYCSSAPIFDGQCVYGVSYDRKVHKYSISDKNWSIVN